MRWPSLAIAVLLAAPIALALSPPSAPQSPSASTGAAVGEIDLAWSAPLSEGASPVAGYHIYRSLSAGSLAHLALVPNVTSFTDSTVPDARPYFYRIAAVNGDGEGPLTDAVSAQAKSPPTAPTAFATATGPGTTNVTLSWAAPVHNGLAPILDYRVYRASSWTGPFTLHATVSGSTFSYVDAIGTINTTFAYKVSALNVHGEGEATAVHNASTAHRSSAPMNVTAAQVFPVSGLLITWDRPLDTGGIPVMAWNVYRSIDGGAFNIYVSITPQFMRYHEERCPIQSTCAYQVAALSALGVGTRSDPTDALMGDAIPVTGRCVPCGNS